MGGTAAEAEDAVRVQVAAAGDAPLPWHLGRLDGGDSTISEWSITSSSLGTWTGSTGETRRRRSTASTPSTQRREAHASVEPREGGERRYDRVAMHARTVTRPSWRVMRARPMRPQQRDAVYALMRRGGGVRICVLDTF